MTESSERMALKASTSLVWIDCEVCDGEGEEEGEFVVDADLLPLFCDWVCSFVR